MRERLVGQEVTHRNQGCRRAQNGWVMLIPTESVFLAAERRGLAAPPAPPALPLRLDCPDEERVAGEHQGAVERPVPAQKGEGAAERKRPDAERND